jgi:hypothetical protein
MQTPLASANTHITQAIELSREANGHLTKALDALDCAELSGNDVAAVRIDVEQAAMVLTSSVIEELEGVTA